MSTFAPLPEMEIFPPLPARKAPEIVRDIAKQLHGELENANHFMFYENWETRDLWQTHMSAPHMATYMQTSDGAVEQFTLHEMTHVG